MEINEGKLIATSKSEAESLSICSVIKPSIIIKQFMEQNFSEKNYHNQCEEG